MQPTDPFDPETLAALDGEPYTLDGISGTIHVATYLAVFPYRHPVTRITHEPDAAGRATPTYRALRQQLHGDWVTELTDSDRLGAVVAAIQARRGAT